MPEGAAVDTIAIRRMTVFVDKRPQDIILHHKFRAWLLVQRNSGGIHGTK